MGEFGALGYALGLAAALALGLFALSYLLVPRAADGERLTAYECGFDPFGDSRTPFDVRFYLVAILFIVFDLEVSFLFPWSLAARAGGPAAYGAVVAFLGVLTVGFLYEWVRGALDW
jgi:NADH-quinone oxidoreductase subunit A